MQDYTEQAKKQGIELKKTGPCQFCGALLTNGVIECVERYSLGFGHLDFSDPNHNVSKFLSVDAHALQHPEIHGRWSNHFHLIRLHLILEREIKWDYYKSPLLSNYLNLWKERNESSVFLPPKIGKKGNITVLDIANVDNTKDCESLILKWATEVYNSWSLHHMVCKEITIGFLADRKTANKTI